MKRDLGYVADGEGVANGTPCYKVSAHRDHGVVTLWIGKDDHALHRIASRSHIDGKLTGEEIARRAAGLPEEWKAEVVASMRTPKPFVAENTIDYFPVFDRQIDPTRFDFTPPAAGHAETTPE